MIEQAKALLPQLIAWRRDFHRHPELGFQEERTAGVVARTLQALGLAVQTSVGKTGVVGALGTGRPVVALRADMDALPIQEEHAVDYASQHPGIMHACGHDAHTAMLLGVACLLAQLPQRPAGQVRFLFQPSEERRDAENKSGAVRMIEAGALADVDAVIALHVDSEMPAHQIRMTPGAAMAASDLFLIKLQAAGGHGAFPHLGRDPIYMVAHVLQAIYALRSRRIDPTCPAVISVGALQAGQAPNVIPSEVTLSGTIRTFDEETRRQLHEELQNALRLVHALGGDFTLELKPGYPLLYNNPRISEVIRRTTIDLLGESALDQQKIEMGSEDFSYMTQQTPGALFFLGARYDEERRPHHTPLFDINEAVLATGAALLAESSCRLLKTFEH